MGKSHFVDNNNNNNNINSVEEFDQIPVSESKDLEATAKDVINGDGGSHDTILDDTFMDDDGSNYSEKLMYTSKGDEQNTLSLSELFNNNNTICEHVIERLEHFELETGVVPEPPALESDESDPFNEHEENDHDLSESSETELLLNLTSSVGAGLDCLPVEVKDSAKDDELKDDIPNPNKTLGTFH